MSRFPTLGNANSFLPLEDSPIVQPFILVGCHEESSIQIPTSIDASDPSPSHASLRSSDCPSRMSVSRKLLLFFILLFAKAVSADGGDDFANNLFSDLGPLLALFGERVTMQFMSGSMGWADNIILAMAPLGIITAIIGAIRVGAPSWLKAVIGRARENLAVAEAELMSSTSQELCELWNGQEVVRCMGSPSVTEFICLLPTTRQDSQRTLEIKVDKDLSALDDHDKDLERVDLNINADIDRWRASRSHPSDKDSEDTTTKRSDNMIIIKRNVSLDAPNISLNTHCQSSRRELRIVAAFGTILQLGVLVYSGFATYHPTLKFPKDDNPIAGYAYPCAATGTFVLVVGMMLCGHVVESSTAEKRFQAKPGTNKRVRMVWLQQTKTVSDQVFGSFAIYAKDDQTFITTSRRSQQDEIEQSQSATDKGECSTSDDLDHTTISRPNLPMTDGKDASVTIQFKTVLGTMTTLTGFVLQFVGLRGLHWSASIAQLGAVFLMVCLKAWVRRGLATPPKAISLPPGYELDWEDDARLRMEESNGELGLRLLGLHTAALYQDLRWWVPKDLLRIFGVQEGKQPEEPEEPQEQRYRQENDEGHVFEVETHRIIGYGQQKVFRQETRDGAKKNRNSIRFSRKDLPEEITEDDEDEVAEDSGTDTVLATESYSSMPKLFSQHIFSAFMYAVAGMDEKKEFFQDVADVQPDTGGDSSWKSFTLRNATLSAMIREIESSGLGSLADIYLSVIPPLSEKNILPQADDAIIEMAREKAKQHEQLEHWEEATKIYLWLFRTVNTFKERGMLTKTTAVLMEYLRQISSTIDLREGDVDYILGPLKEAKKSIEEELNKSADHQMLLGLMRLYAKQGREWKCAAICEQNARAGREQTRKQLEEFKFTKLHRRAQRGDYVFLSDFQRSDLIVKDIHHWTPLHYAARNRFWTRAHNLLDAGADVNSIDLNGCTPLHYACQFSMEMDREVEDRERTIDKLIREGADVNSQGRDGMTPLHYASMEGNEGIVTVLTEAGANVDITDASGNTPLLWAVRKGALGTAQNLWQFSNQRLRDTQGRTALHLAALSGVADMTEWLITKGGADKEARDRAKYRPIHWAAENGHEKIVDLLINKCVAKDAKSSAGYTPLHCAASNGHTRVMALLLQHGLGINDTCENGSTALHGAAYGGHEEAVKFLIQQGADKDAQLTYEHALGITPLHHAAEKGHEKVAALLIQHGANPEAKGKNGVRPLHKASQEGHEGIVNLLIGLKVDIEARYAPERPLAFSDIGSLTPLHYAAGYGRANIVKILIDAGAKTDVLDKDEPSRLSLAVLGGHIEVAKQLIENGSDVHEPRNKRKLHINMITMLGSSAQRSKHNAIGQSLRQYSILNSIFGLRKSYALWRVLDTIQTIGSVEDKDDVGDDRDDKNDNRTMENKEGRPAGTTTTRTDKKANHSKSLHLPGQQSS
ncbi:hypothetical protein CcaCcLH18_11458 [Colletotrichum camelliae]|nr:hypothetical protein CcaCcLH18_11458 [Colletotrichum camelliae]